MTNINHSKKRPTNRRVSKGAAKKTVRTSSQQAGNVKVDGSQRPSPGGFGGPGHGGPGFGGPGQGGPGFGGPGHGGPGFGGPIGRPPIIPIPIPIPLPFPGGGGYPGGFPGGGGYPGGGYPGGPAIGGAPQGPPPTFVPSKPYQSGGASVLAVDPGSISGCRNRFVYLWLRNGESYWAYITFVGPRSIAGYRWIGFNWVYFGIDLRLIEQFYCY